MCDYLPTDSKATGNDNSQLNVRNHSLSAKYTPSTLLFVLFKECSGIHSYGVRPKAKFFENKDKTFLIVYRLKNCRDVRMKRANVYAEMAFHLFRVFTFFASAREPLNEAVKVNGPIANRIFIYHLFCALFVLGRIFHQTLTL